MTPKYPYVAAHQRIQNARGKASTHECMSCGLQAYDWAYNHSAPDPNELTDEAGLVYSNDPSYYTPMCRKCHRQYDVVHAKPECPKGHSYSGDNLYMTAEGSRVCRACQAAWQREIRKTPEHKAKERDRAIRRRADYVPKPPRPEVTHCPQGHAYEGYNLILSNGKKKCRECGRARSRRYYHTHKEAA